MVDRQFGGARGRRGSEGRGRRGGNGSISPRGAHGIGWCRSRMLGRGRGIGDNGGHGRGVGGADLRVGESGRVL